MILGYPSDAAQSIVHRLNCQLGFFPTAHLGIPISDSRLSVVELRLTVAKLEHRIEPWQGRWLSKAARTVLINSSLSSLLLFLMSFYSLPETLHHEIATVQRVSFGPAMEISRSTTWFGGRRSANRATKEAWGSCLPNNKYLRGQPLAFCQRSGGSQLWQSLIQLLQVLRIGTSIKVGVGASTLFWFDRWAGESPFAARFPTLFSIAVVPRISVEEALIDLGHLAFRRPFGPMDTLVWQDLPELDRPDDRISWRLEPAGCFSMKSFYRAIVPSQGIEPFAALWEIRLPLKIRIFL
ncbi:ABC transporter G family member 37 [Hordeum vulgare]|nr:ABC transporter G family member 37 [Hordeum vulgare]